MKYETYNKFRRFLFANYFRFYHRLKVIGLENIPEGPALIVPNHSGGWDLDILCLSNHCHPTRDIQVLIMDEWHYINHIWGKLYVGSGIPLWLRGGIRWKYINPYLHKNGSQFPGLVAIFPEGHSGLFHRRHMIYQFFPGVVRIALKYKIPIIPVATANFHKIAPILAEEIPESGPPKPTALTPITFPFRAKVEFGKPFELDEYYDMDLTKEEETWIANNIIRPKIANIRQKYTKVELAKVDLKMKKP